MSYRSFYTLSILCIVIIVGCLMWLTPVNSDLSREEVRKNVHILPPDSLIDASLLSRLSGHRIILLGEQTHYDGKTLCYKEALIKHLHDSGYNVVLYEAGMYDMWQMARNDSLRPLAGLYYFWYKNEESSGLWNFYRHTRQMDFPIVLGGFDVQDTGNVPDSIRLNKLSGYLLTKNIDLHKFPDFIRCHPYLKYIPMDDKVVHKLLPSNQASLLFADLDRIAIAIKRSMQPGNVTDEFYYRYIKNLHAYLKVCYKYSPGEELRMNLRDSLMAENFIWLADTLYKDQKIIVWTANLHAMYENNYTHNFRTFGSYLKKHFANDIKSVVFSSYGRMDDEGHFFQRLSRKSLEYQLHSCDISACYLDFQELDSSSSLKHKFISGINQGLSIEDHWSDKVDIMIYIDKMTNPVFVYGND